ncbi:type II toxin-antitoxin system VapB family antitoxin [uncultured Jatrophihabitans sp.]|uniref:type II toxin-antitoxin system VapB family antitoxin n=1 Tax=uncultured Jatrophihabitans sp. TaxID=1610747 RepID=UPI0035CC0FEE
MSRTNIDIDDDDIAWVMHTYRFHTKREAVGYALKRLRIEPMSRAEMLAMQGVGWEGDLDAMRAAETPAVI